MNNRNYLGMLGTKAGVSLHSGGGAVAATVRIWMWLSLVAVGIFAWTTDAAIVDAGSLTSISTKAPLYDTSLSSANGCDPSGCVGDLTRVMYRVQEPLAVLYAQCSIQSALSFMSVRKRLEIYSGKFTINYRNA